MTGNYVKKTDAVIGDKVVITDENGHPIVVTDGLLQIGSTTLATEATLASIDVSVASIDGKIDKCDTDNVIAVVSGTVAVSNITECNTDDVTITASVLPAGAATSALQTSGNSTLSDIKTNTSDNATETTLAGISTDTGNIDTNTSNIESNTDIPNTPRHNEITVTTAGTRVQFTASDIPIKGGVVKADKDNDGNIYLGGSGVDSSNGFDLAPGESVPVFFRNLNLLWADADTDGNKARYIAGSVV